MHKVLIVDDEPLAREHILKVVDWEKLNLEVCGEASDGADALSKTLEHRPDIILLDLIMPVIDGLSFAEQLKRHEIKANIIIITGSDEFEFIQKSLKLHVKDYLLKPFDIGELENTLLRISNEICRTSLSTTRIKKSIIINLLLNPNKENIIISNNFFNFDNKVFQVSVFYSAYESRLDRLYGKLSKHYADDENMVFVKSGGNRIICFCSQDLETKTVDLGKMIQLYFDENLIEDQGFLVGVSNEYFDISKIDSAYNEAVRTVNNGIIFVDKGVKLHSNLHSDTAGYYYSSKDIEQLLVHLRRGDKERVVDQLNDIFEKLVKGRVEYDHLIQISNGLISICFSNMIEKNSLVQKGPDVSELISFRNRKIDDIQKDVISFYTKSIDQYLGVRLTKSQKAAQGCVQLIEREYGNSDLSAQRIGLELDLDESYLRRVFKKEMGKTINEYIIDFRMQKARKLLLQRLYKHSEISDMIGYEDAAYFSKSFKKNVGLSPKEFEISN